LSPFVLLLYPLWIAPVTIFVGCWGGTVGQISWHWDSWLEAVRSPDSGFMGWACAQLNLPDCSPYQVVLIGGSEAESLVVNTPRKSPGHQTISVRPTPI